MIRLILLLIVYSTTLLNSYAQDTEDVSYKEINTYLVDGLECEELLNQSEKQISICDSTVARQTAIINAKSKEMSEAYELYDWCKEENAKLNTSLQKVKRKNRILKNILIGTYMVVAAEIATLVRLSQIK